MNGNIQCFRSFHLVLALIAIIVLALCIGIIPVVFVYSQGCIEVSRCTYLSVRCQRANLPFVMYKTPLCSPHYALPLQKPLILYETFRGLSSAFNPHYPWWTAVELFRRLTFVLFIVAFPGNNVSRGVFVHCCKMVTVLIIICAVPCNLLPGHRCDCQHIHAAF